MIPLSRFKIIILYFLSTISLLGCTIHYTPLPYPIKEGLTPQFTSNKPVEIINAVIEPKIKIIGVSNAYTYYGDLREYTDTAVNLLRSELNKKNIQVLPGSAKNLQLEVVDAEIFYTQFIYRTTTTLKVTTASGYTQEYYVMNSSGLYNRAIDGAITKAVTALLKDYQIINYLKK